MAGLAAAALLAIGGASAPSASAAKVVTVAPASTTDTNTFPFGRGDNWGNHMGFVYKNLQPFSLKAGDTLAFDLVAANDVPQQMEIAMSATTINSGDIPAGAFTTVVPNTVVPTGTGNAVKGDYDLAYRVATPFNFTGGGLIIKFSNPTPAFEADATNSQVMLNNLTNSLDASGFFASRFIQDADGLFPWTGAVSQDNIAGFRLNIADPVKKKKCKKGFKLKKVKTKKGKKRKKCVRVKKKRKKK